MVLGSSSDYACRIWSLVDHRLRVGISWIFVQRISVKSMKPVYIL